MVLVVGCVSLLCLIVARYCWLLFVAVGCFLFCLVVIGRWLLVAYRSLFVRCFFFDVVDDVHVHDADVHEDADEGDIEDKEEQEEEEGTGSSRQGAGSREQGERRNEEEVKVAGMRMWFWMRVRKATAPMRLSCRCDEDAGIVEMTMTRPTMVPVTRLFSSHPLHLPPLPPSCCGWSSFPVAHHPGGYRLCLRLPPELRFCVPVVLAFYSLQ